MDTTSEKHQKLKIFQKGQVVIPTALRKKHHIHIGDQVEVISKPEGILLKPSISGKDLRTSTERLFGMFKKYRIEKTVELKDTDISDATEQGFIDGWS